MNETLPTTPIRVYVAAPYGLHPQVRGVHARLREHGMEWTSGWAERALQQKESEKDLTPENICAIRAKNHFDLQMSDALLVLGHADMCETLVEVGLAITRRLAIAWVEVPGVKVPLSVRDPSIATIASTVMGAAKQIKKIIQARDLSIFASDTRKP